MVFIDGLEIIVADILPMRLLEPGKQVGNVFGEGALIPFDRQHVVGVLVNNLPGNLSLTAHRINGHHTAFHRQHLQ